jgi:hypothetical protein
MGHEAINASLTSASDSLWMEDKCSYHVNERNWRVKHPDCGGRQILNDMIDKRATRNQSQEKPKS